MWSGVNMYIILRKDGKDREIFTTESSKYAANQYDKNLFEVVPLDKIIDMPGSYPAMSHDPLCIFSAWS